MGKLAAALAALRYGSSLTDSTSWKQRQTTINTLIGLMGAALVFYPVEISHEDLELIAGGVAVLLGLLNGYLTTATSDKVGVGAPVQSSDRRAGP